MKQSVFLHGKQTTGRMVVKLNSAYLAGGYAVVVQYVCFQKCLSLLKQRGFQWNAVRFYPFQMKKLKQLLVKQQGGKFKWGSAI